MSNPERSPSEWFAEAARCYEEGHQACAWCGGPYQVFRVTQDSGVGYHCYHCDFHIAHNVSLDHYALVPGETKVKKGSKATMHGG
jgi:hypothetical protein